MDAKSLDERVNILASQAGAAVYKWPREAKIILGLRRRLVCTIAGIDRDFAGKICITFRGVSPKISASKCWSTASAEIVSSDNVISLKATI